ncbi:MAG: DUF6702 family protein [Bacteroidales bacterium]
MKFVLTAALASFMNVSFAYHPVHVSVTNIELKKSEQKIEYSIRIFADDFEYALMHLYEKEIALTDSVSEEEKKLVLMYISAGFGIEVDGIKQVPECGEIKYHDQSAWIFCEINLTDNEIKKIKVINRLLIDFFPDQTNLTVFSADEYQAGFQFDLTNHETEIDMGTIKNGKVQNQ